MLLSGGVARFLLSLEGVASPQTIIWYRAKLGALVAFLGDGEMDGVTTDDLRRWRVALTRQAERYADHPKRPTASGGLSVWTVHGHLRAVRRLFRWCVDEGLASRNPAARLEMPPLPKGPRRGIAEEDLERMVHVADDARDRALLLFLASTACRVGGAVGLRLDDLDMAHAQATVYEKGRGGQRKARVVFLRPPACAAMAEWLRERPPAPHDRVFVGRKGPLTRGGIYALLKRLAKRAGVTLRWNPHAFRHGAARGMLLRGAPLGQVSQILGHSGVAVTNDFYGVFANHELREAHTRYARVPGEEDQGPLNP